MRFAQVNGEVNLHLRICAPVVVEPYLNIGRAKFQVDVSIFGKHIAQEPNLLITPFFKLRFFCIYRPRIIIKMSVLESGDQTGSETDIFIRKYQFENLPICDPRLT